MMAVEFEAKTITSSRTNYGCAFWYRVRTHSTLTYALLVRHANDILRSLIVMTPLFHGHFSLARNHMYRFFGS
jgi:hypothetical protein